VNCQAKLLLVTLILLTALTAARPASAQPAAAAGDTFNVLFVGADGSRLLMAAVFAVDRQNEYQSGAVFIPASTMFLTPRGPVTLAQVFQAEDMAGLAPFLEDQLQADLAYYIRIEKKVLNEIKGVIPPITVAGQEVPLEDLFTMSVTPWDEEIMGRLLEEFTRPAIYFYYLPRLVFNGQGYITTDFHPTLENLWLCYSIATGVDPAQIKKVVVNGRALTLNGQKVLLVPDSALTGALSLATSP